MTLNLNLVHRSKLQVNKDTAESVKFNILCQYQCVSCVLTAVIIN